jgi:hypothetical protein
MSDSAAVLQLEPAVKALLTKPERPSRKAPCKRQSLVVTTEPSTANLEHRGRFLQRQQAIGTLSLFNLSRRCADEARPQLNPKGFKLPEQPRDVSRRKRGYPFGGLKDIDESRPASHPMPFLRLEDSRHGCTGSRA